MTTQLEKMNAEAARMSDLVKDILQDFYCCTRVWEAWQVGTMTEEDFIPCFGDIDIFSDTAV